MAQFSKTLNDPYPQFQGHAILWRWISQKRYEIHSFKGILIGTYIRSTVSFRMTLSDLGKCSMTRSVARSLRQLSFLSIIWGMEFFHSAMLHVALQWHDIEFARWQHHVMWYVALESCHWFRQVAVSQMGGGQICPDPTLWYFIFFPSA